VRTWLDHAWSAIRPAVIDGAIVYGPPRGAEATFIHTDGWLGPQPRLSTDEARAELMRRFLSAFGPASPHDFARWSGLKTTEAKAILTAIERDVQEVDVDGARGWALRSDVAAIASSRIEPDAVRLLPAFDSFLLAHATKEHLVERRFYERVYRPQGWISPTVLQRGRVIGVWFQQAAGRNVTLDVQLFKRARPHVREAIGGPEDRAVILFSDVVEVLDLLCFNLCVVLLPLSAVRRRNVTRCRLPLRKADGEASLAHGLRDSWRVRRSQIVAGNWSEVRPRPVNVTKPLDLSSCACH